MPIKSKRVNPQRIADAAKGRLSSAGAAYAERQARVEEQKRKWAAEEEEDDDNSDNRKKTRGQASSGSSASSSPAASPLHSRTKSSASTQGRGKKASLQPTTSQKDTTNMLEDDDEAALLAAAQERTRRFLSAGNDVPCGRAGPSPSMERLVAYEAAKRREAMRQAEAVSSDDDAGVFGEEARGGEVITAEAMRDAPAMPPPPHNTTAAARKAGVAQSSGSTPAKVAKGEDCPSQGQTTTYIDPLQHDFNRLMQLLADDLQDERERSLAAAAAAAGDASSTGAAAVGDPTSPSSRAPLGYRPPPRTFAQLQADALQELYEKWNVVAVTGDASLPKSSAPATTFVAKDHEAAAFALAAAAAARASTSVDSRAASSLSSRGALFTDAPLSIDDLVAVEAALRSASKPRLVAASRGQGAPREGRVGGDEASRVIAGDYAGLSAKGIADAAQNRLSRFLQAVAWTERLVRDPAFVGSVADFLYQNHRAFLAHFANGAISPDAMASSAATTKTGTADQDTQQSDNRHSTTNGDGVREFSHEEFIIYERFAKRVSGVLLRVLKDHVPGFDEEEFVEDLFDSPADAYALPSVRGATPMPGPQRVLSYPAWRIILSTSSFESFLSWMTDYIQEEYQLGQDPVREEAVVAVGGTRGLRALIKSTYHRSLLPTEEGELTGPDAPPAEAVDDGEGAEGSSPSETAKRTTLADHLIRDDEGSPPHNDPLQVTAPLNSVHPPAAVATAETHEVLTPPPVSFANAGTAGVTSSSPVPAEGPSGHLRHSQQMFSPPLSSAASDDSLRPRNHHVGAGMSRNKKLSATATRDLPPLTSTPPPHDPLGDSVVMTTTTTAEAPTGLRPSSQPTRTRQNAPAAPTRGAAPSTSHPAKTASRTASVRQRGASVGRASRLATSQGGGGRSPHSRQTASRTTSKGATAVREHGATATVKKPAGVKPKLKRAT